MVLNVNCFQVELGYENLSLWIFLLSCEISFHKNLIEQCKTSKLAQLQNKCVQNGYSVDGRLQAFPRIMH